MRLLHLLAIGSSVLALASTAQAVTIANTPNGGSISSFGFPDSQTYGQVFTAPVSGKLSSFTLYLDGPIGGQLYGGIGDWNGASTFDFNYGVSQVDYESAPVDADHDGAYTFSPNIDVLSGHLYVAYLSVWGLDHTNQVATSMPLGGDAPINNCFACAESISNINYFVWNNSDSPSNSSWNYFFDAGSARFSATVDPSGGVPEPAAWALMIGGFGFAGAALRRRRAVAA